jgi:hypothetical protein
MIQAGTSGAQTGDDIAQTLSMSQLPKAEGQKLIVLAQTPGCSGGGERLDAARKLFGMQSGVDLGKYGRR